MRALALPLLLIGFLSAQAQEDWDWWNETHQWDGVTHWWRYLTPSAYYLGPNALPVPSLMNGELDDEVRLSLGAEGHFSSGDDTQDLMTGLHAPFAGGRVALQLDWMALEHYTMDTVTRDERAARDRDGTGVSTGDLYVATLVQLVQENDDHGGLLLRIRLKTASGNNLAGARHSETPGYSFDLSWGRWLKAGSGWLKRWRPHAMAGFLVYQTNRDDFYQNDCLLFGAGVLGDHGGLRSEVGVAGYLGYLDLRDRPIVLRAALTTNRPGKLEHRLGVQAPVQDWRYLSVAYTLRVYLGGPLWSGRDIR